MQQYKKECISGFPQCFLSRGDFCTPPSLRAFRDRTGQLLACSPPWHSAVPFIHQRQARHPPAGARAHGVTGPVPATKTEAAASAPLLSFSTLQGSVQPVSRLISNFDKEHSPLPLAPHSRWPLGPGENPAALAPSLASPRLWHHGTPDSK